MASHGKEYESDSDKIEKHQKVVDANLRELRCNSTKFAAENIRNAKLRKEYIDMAKKAAKEILQEARNNVNANPSRALQIWEEAAEKSSKLRNMHLDQTRQNVSKAFSKMLKEEGLTFPKLIQKYTSKLAETGTESAPYATLEILEQQKIMEGNVEASGRTNPKINSFSKWSGRVGIVLILITIGISIYVICEAANPALEAVKTAVSLGFGAAAGYVGTELGTAIGACGGPVGALLAQLLGELDLGSLHLLGESHLKIFYTGLSFHPLSQAHDPHHSMLFRYYTVNHT